MNKRLIDVVKKALEQDNTIATNVEGLESAKGHTEEYMAYLGLSRNDLKKLERQGLAIRGYTKNEWGPGEKLPNGKDVGENGLYRGKGSKIMWILVGKGA